MKIKSSIMYDKLTFDNGMTITYFDENDSVLYYNGIRIHNGEVEYNTSIIGLEDLGIVEALLEIYDKYSTMTEEELLIIQALSECFLTDTEIDYIFDSINIYNEDK